MDLSHLDALEYRLHNERVRLSCARTHKEIEIRKVWVSQIEREIEHERQFLGLTITDVDRNDDITDDELLAELGS